MGRSSTRNSGVVRRSTEVTHVENKAMEEKLNKDECLDVNVIGTPLKNFEGKVWELHKFVEDIDYCDATHEEWIRSIGQHRYTQKIYAAVDTRFYLNPLFECLWLR